MTRSSLPPSAQRLKTWQASLPAGTLALLSNPADIRYLTGFESLLPAEREAFVTATRDQVCLWYASFSPLPEPLALPAKPMRGLGTVISALAEPELASQFQALQFDAANLTVAEYQRLQTLAGVELASLSRSALIQQRTHKDATELEKLQQAAELTTTAVQVVQPQLKPGLTEQAVAWLLEQAIRERGATGLAFPTIVAFGDHTALPHHQPTLRKLETEMPVLIDFGAQYQGYCGDMTRTWWFGHQPTSTFQTIKTAVDQAYEAAITLITSHQAAQTRPTAAEIDQAARAVITEAGYGPQFIHTTGHGVGLEIHEPPSLNWQNTEALQPGTCFTIEPGIYLPGECGYRYENTLWLTAAKLVTATQLAMSPLSNHV